MFLKTKQLAVQFGFCKRTIVKIIHEMEELDEYKGSILKPCAQGGSYRADPEAVFSFLSNKREKEACGS